MKDGDWQEAAPCRQVDPELFYPDSGANTIKGAKVICRGCPYKAPCLLIVLEKPELGRAGVWGGLSNRELRKAIRDWHKDVA